MTAEAAIRADERACIRSLLPYHVPCCPDFLASVADLVNEHGDDPATDAGYPGMVTVSREDLRAALTATGVLPDDVYDRLMAAAGDPR